MIVTRLEAKNYRQHPHIDADFDGQLVGLIGDNGTGKSNFLKAIRHGFIGADSGETKHKETKKLPYITWGEDDGYVKVHFTHNGKAGEIHRTFSHKKTDAYFSYDGMECEGTTNVNNAVEEVLGMDKEVARQAVFVGQDDLDSILFTDPRIRKLAWQKLCGIGQVNNIHAKMGEVIKSLPPVQDYAGQIRDAEFQLADLEEELKEKTKTLLEAKAELPKENNLDKQAENLRKMQTLQRDSLSLKVDIEKYDKQLEADEPNLTELEKVAHDSTTAKTKLENLKEQERNLEAAKEADFQIVRVKGTITSAEMDIIDLEKAIAAMPSEEDLQATQDEVSRLQNTGSLYDTLGNALELDNNLDSCVLCGQDLSDPEEVRKHIMTSREAINKELEQKDDSQEALDRRRTYEKNLELARERLKGYQDQLWQIKTSDIKYDEAVYLDTVANIALIEQEINEAARHTEKVIKLRETVRINKESKQTATDKLAVLITEAQNLIQETGMQPMNLDQQLAEVNAEKVRVQEIDC
jgi:DNA repair exonuclease SbcCD ATPase subunit